MTVGRLEHRVQIERETVVKDAGGGGASTWALLATRWCDIKAVRGGERLEAGATRSATAFLFIMRQDDVTRALTATDRLVWVSEGIIYDITSVRRGLPSSRRIKRFMTVEARTQVGQKV